jgi:hypothetical protein
VSLTRYATLVMATVAAVCGASLVAFSLDDPGRAAVLLGGALAAANTVAAYFLATWAANTRSNAVFMQAVLGGMLARMMVLLGAVVAAIVLLGLPRLPLVISLLTHFVIFLVLEIAVLHRHLPTPSEAR